MLQEILALASRFGVRLDLPIDDGRFDRLGWLRQMNEPDLRNLRDRLRSFPEGGNLDGRNTPSFLVVQAITAHRHARLREEEECWNRICPAPARVDFVI